MCRNEISQRTQIYTHLHDRGDRLRGCFHQSRSSFTPLVIDAGRFSFTPAPLRVYDTARRWNERTATQCAPRMQLPWAQARRFPLPRHQHPWYPSPRHSQCQLLLGRRRRRRPVRETPTAQSVASAVAFVVVVKEGLGRHQF